MPRKSIFLLVHSSTILVARICQLPVLENQHDFRMSQFALHLCTGMIEKEANFCCRSLDMLAEGLFHNLHASKSMSCMACVLEKISRLRDMRRNLLLHTEQKLEEPQGIATGLSLSTSDPQRTWTKCLQTGFSRMESIGVPFIPIYSRKKSTLPGKILPLPRCLILKLASVASFPNVKDEPLCLRHSMST